MRFNKKATLAVAGISVVAVSGAWAQTGQSTSGTTSGGTAQNQNTQAAQKAQAMGISPAMLAGLTQAEQRTLTNLLNRMTATERQAVAKLVRNSSRNMNGSDPMGTGTGTTGSGTGTSGSGAGTGTGTGTGTGSGTGTTPR